MKMPPLSTLKLSTMAALACLLAAPAALAQDKPGEGAAGGMKSERAISGGAMKPESSGTTSQRAVSGGAAKPDASGGSERALPPGK